MNATYFEVLKINEGCPRQGKQHAHQRIHPPPGNPLRSASLPDRGSHLPNHLDQPGELGQLRRRLRQCRSHKQLQNSQNLQLTNLSENLYNFYDRTA